MGLIRALNRSLTARILLAFALVIVVTIGGVALLANQRTTAEFQSYLRTAQPDDLRRYDLFVTTVYQETHSWTQVAGALAALPSGPPHRVVVVDPTGQVVVDTSRDWQGKLAANLPLSEGRAVVADGRSVATVYVLEPAFEGPGGNGGPFGPPGGGPFSGPENQFLARVNQSLILAAVGAVLVALVLGWLFARQIIRPLDELTLAAQRIARGHYDERIALAGEDEVGQLARAFNHMAASLERTEQARRQLVADVAHELRTPLTVIDGTVQAMQDGVLPLDDANLATIHEEVVALSHLVTDLRDLSLGDVGEFPIRPEMLDAGALVERVVGAFGAEAAARGIALVAEVAPALPTIRADPERLQQCLRNLLANALQHTPVGGRIVARAQPTAGGVEIAVSDTGAGIAPEHLPHLFERFYRADASRARRSGGTGLGLAIVQQIVAAHGGTVRATSAGLGRGATFTIRLPAAGPARASDIPAQGRVDLLPGVLEDIPDAGQGRGVGAKDAALGK